MGIYRARIPVIVIIRIFSCHHPHLFLSSSAKADDPVNASAAPVSAMTVSDYWMPRLRGA
jgi:hypothetical protein